MPNLKAQLKPSLGGLYSPWLFGDLQLSVQEAGTPHDKSHTRMMDGQGQGMQLMNEPQTKQWLFVTPRWPLASQGHFPSTESGCFSCGLPPTLTNIALLKSTPSQKLVTNLTQSLIMPWIVSAQVGCVGMTLGFAELNNVSAIP